MLNSLKGLKDLCYSVGDLAMFVPKADLEGVNIVKKWHDDTKSRVTDLDEATARLSQYVLERGDEEVDVDAYGPAIDSEKQEQEALVQEQGTQVQGQEEARRGAGRTQVQTVAQESAFTMAHVEPFAEEEQSVSGATLSGAAQAASHPNVAHFMDTLVRMDYCKTSRTVGICCQTRWVLNLWGDATRLRSTLKARLTPRKRCWSYAEKAKWNS
jgi:hypothetical protein